MNAVKCIHKFRSNPVQVTSFRDGISFLEQGIADYALSTMNTQIRKSLNPLDDVLSIHIFSTPLS